MLSHARSCSVHGQASEWVAYTLSKVAIGMCTLPIARFVLGLDTCRAQRYCLLSLPSCSGVTRGSQRWHMFIRFYQRPGFIASNDRYDILSLAVNFFCIAHTLLPIMPGCDVGSNIPLTSSFLISRVCSSNADESNAPGTHGLSGDPEVLRGIEQIVCCSILEVNVASTTCRM